MFEAQEVRWKYFYNDENGKLCTSYIMPEHKEMLAPLLLSRGVDDQNYRTAVKRIAAEGFCACVPCKIGVEEISDDPFSNLNYRSENYKFLSDGTFPTSPQEGASQLIAAMKAGYDVIDFTGGTCMEQKLVLVKDYFRTHDLPAQKIKFWGFSNGSTPMLYLSDLLQQIHSPSAYDIFVDRSKTECVDAALSAIRGEIIQVAKKMICVNQEARDQYQSVTVEESEAMSYTVNSQMLLHNLDSFEEWRPPAGKDFVLCVEGITSLHGFAPYEAVEKIFAKWDELGILHRLKHLELGEIVSYDKDAATQVQQEKAAIEFLCDQYKIALVTGFEGRRTGHGQYRAVDPCNVPCRIKVGEDGVLEQITEFLDHNPPRVPAPKFSANHEPLTPPIFPEMPRPQLSQASYNPEARIVDRRSNSAIDVQVVPINQAAEEMLTNSLGNTQRLKTEVCGGKMYNVIDYRTDPNFGLLLVNDSAGRNSIMLPMQDALMRGRLGTNDLSKGCDVPFVAIVLCNDQTLNEEERQKFIRSNEPYVRKLVDAFGVTTPIFVVRDQVEIADSLFVGNLRMQRAMEIPSVSAATSSLVSGARTLSQSQSEKASVVK